MLDLVQIHTFNVAHEFKEEYKEVCLKHNCKYFSHCPIYGSPFSSLPRVFWTFVLIVLAIINTSIWLLSLYYVMWLTVSQQQHNISQHIAYVTMHLTSKINNPGCSLHYPVNVNTIHMIHNRKWWPTGEGSSFPFTVTLLKEEIQWIGYIMLPLCIMH